MGSLREKLLEEDHQRALAQMVESQKTDERDERIDALEKRLEKLEAWTERQDTIALEESEY